MQILKIYFAALKIFSTFEIFLENEDSGGAKVRAYDKAIKMVTYELEKSNPDIILSGFDIAANAAVQLLVHI